MRTGMGMAVLALAACSMLLCGAGCEQQKVKAGFVYLNTIGDTGWTFAHEQARQELLKEPYISAAPYIELVEPFDNATVEAAIEQLIGQGCGIVFTTSFEFMDATLAQAGRHPEAYFMHCSGYKTADNMGTYFARIEEAVYLTGIMAGALSTRGAIGYVAPVKIPEVYRGINAFTIGVRERNPQARVLVKWVNSWYDPAAETLAAQELVALGVDVLAHGQDSPAVNQVAQEQGLPSFGYNTDMSSYAPQSHLTAPVWNWTPFYKHYCAMVRDRTWQTEQSWWGFEKNAIGLSPMSERVPAALAAAVDQRRQELAEGAFVIFKGPLYDTQGVLRYAEGQSATDAELLAMDYLLQGVSEL